MSGSDDSFEMPVGSHVLKDPNDEFEVLERLPKAVQDAIRNSPVPLRVHWKLLNVPTRAALRIVRGAIADIQKQNPVFEPVTASSRD